MATPVDRQGIEPCRLSWQLIRLPAARGPDWACLGNFEHLKLVVSTPFYPPGI